MNKFKKIMLGALSVLTLGLFVSTGAKVNAEATPAFGPLTESISDISASGYVYGSADTNFAIVNGSSSAKCKNVATTIDGKSFSYGIQCNSNGKGFTFKAKVAMTVDIYFAVGSSSSLSGDAWTFGSLLNGSGTSAGYHITPTMSANQETTLSASGKRIWLYYVAFEASSNVSVTFKDGETTLDTKSLGSGTTITYAPEDKDDAVFNGWVDSNSNPVTTVPSSAVTLYATWTPKRTITFVDDDETTVLDTKGLGQGQTITYVPEKDGYTFVGWFDGEDNAVTVVPSTNTTLYAKWSRNPVNGNGTALSTDDLTVSNDESQSYGENIIFDGTIYTMMATSSVPVTVYKQEKTIAGVTYQKYIQFGGSSKFNSSGYARVLKIDTKFAGTLLLTAQSNNSDNKTVTLYDSAAKATSQSNSIGSTGGIYTYELEANQTYYIYSSGDLRIFHAEFVSTPVLEQQENSTGTAIRYIATVKGVTSNALITSWTVTMSIDIDGKADYTADFTELYTAVGGNNGKSAADDTVYLVGTLQNIPAKFNGRTISTTITVTLSNSTTLTSNTVNYLINIPTND